MCIRDSTNSLIPSDGNRAATRGTTPPPRSNHSQGRGHQRGHGGSNPPAVQVTVNSIQADQVHAAPGTAPTSGRVPPVHPGRRVGQQRLQDRRRVTVGQPGGGRQAQTRQRGGAATPMHDAAGAIEGRQVRNQHPRVTPAGDESSRSNQTSGEDNDDPDVTFQNFPRLTRNQARQLNLCLLYTSPSPRD